MSHAQTSAGLIAPPGLIEIARRYVERVGLTRAAQDFGVSRQSLLALLAGQRIRRGTVLLVARALRWPGVAADAS
jgi:hypothetical protein